MLRKMKTIRSQWTLFSLFLMLGLFVWGIGSVSAKEDWPMKQIDFVNPWGAGGAADVQARKLAEIISRDLGQPLVVRNVTGAGGAIAYNEVHRAKPDGYTLIWYSGAINTLGARKQISFDYHAFDPIAGVGFEAVTIAVNKTAPWKDFRVYCLYQTESRQSDDGQFGDWKRDSYGACGHGCKGRNADRSRSLWDRTCGGCPDGRQD
jgi:hypothetical protein